MRLVIVLRHSSLFNGSVHAFDLTVSPRMMRQGKAILNVMFCTDSVKCVAFDGLRCFVIN